MSEGCGATIKTRWVYAEALYKADGATLEELRESVETLEDTARIARRVLGGAHPFTPRIEHRLREAQAALRAREASQCKTLNNYPCDGEANFGRGASVVVRVLLLELRDASGLKQLDNSVLVEELS